jgi:hypothetical protein
VNVLTGSNIYRYPAVKINNIFRRMTTNYNDKFKVKYGRIETPLYINMKTAESRID